MFLLDGETFARTSPTDLRAAASCEFALLRGLDVQLGRRAGVPAPADAMLERVAELGSAHEQRVLRELARSRRVVRLPRPERTAAAFAAAQEATVQALRGDAEVIHQAFLSDGSFHGFADFLVRSDAGWIVVDAKLARSADVPALLQIGAYAALLQDAGVPVAPVVRLVLGDGTTVDHPTVEVVAVARARRARLEEIVQTHLAERDGAQWGDDRHRACGSCAECRAELEAARDVALVAGVHATQRAALKGAGLHTIEELAASEGPVTGLTGAAMTRLRDQARLQLEHEADPAGGVRHSVHDLQALRLLPAPSPGDLFFDFEGDPLHREPGSAHTGLEYLFGLLEVDDSGTQRYTPYWAHDRAAEKQALVDFLGHVARRRAAHPDLHIYHYADYERSTLLKLAVRHGVGEQEIDDLLRDGVLVDLYAVVRGGIRVSQRSYSLKKLEPLYMGAELRDGEVTNAGDSIVAYHDYAEAALTGATDRARELLEQIRSYNEYDCLSTLRLRDWLLARAAEQGIEPIAWSAPESVESSSKAGAGPGAPEPSDAEVVEEGLRALVPTGPGRVRTRDEQAIAMLAAAVQYNRREHKPFWWGHFARLREPIEEWRRATDVFVSDSSTLVEDWHVEGRQINPRRTIEVHGHFPAGGSLSVGATVTPLYDASDDAGLTPQPGHLRVAAKAGVVLDRYPGVDGETLVIEESLRTAGVRHDRRPVALTPTRPPATAAIDAALVDLGEQVLTSGGSMPAQPGLDLLRRIPPRLRSGRLPDVAAGPDGHVDAVTRAVLDLDRSYLGVQGPPGTGKTHVAAQVIRRLVEEHRWRIGVVAQSHAAVENVLAGVVAAGLDPRLVAKPPHGESEPPVWTPVDKDDLAAWQAEHAGRGYVVGGTAWDLTNTRRVAREGLDLVVIDEAGQFSLAATLACSTAAPRLLLLGDPQQLPQVSQGTHPEPIHQSALGWLLDDARVMPAHLGYFLDTTWRMHPRLTRAVSTLAYDGALTSHEIVTASRDLDGVDPGLHVVTVEHRDNSTRSPEESARIVELVRDLLGRRWTDPHESVDRPLGQTDIRIVSPYNPQVDQLRSDLAAAGLGEVPVASVDKFQGQQAPVVIVSLAASSAGDIRRGLDFVLGRNRLNVAVSRGQWAAFIVHSDVLTDAAPRSTRDFLALGTFLGLTHEITADRCPAVV